MLALARRVSLMRMEILELLLLCLGVLVLVQPGAVAFANFDAPYGFVVDLSAWLSAFIGASPVVFGYLAWRRRGFGLRGIVAFSASILALAVLAYAVQLHCYAGFRAPGYRQPIHLLPAYFILSTALALIILPKALFHLPQVYSYDPAMAVINLALIGLTILLGGIWLNQRRGLKEKEKGGEVDQRIG